MESRVFIGSNETSLGTGFENAFRAVIRAHPHSEKKDKGFIPFFALP